MRALALIIAAIIVATLAGLALAEVCTPSGENYLRTYPPAGTTLNHLPVNEPRCVPFMRDTAASNTPLCGMCHPHRYSFPGRLA